MAIPYNNKLLWDSYLTTPNWHINLPEAPKMEEKSQLRRAVNEIFVQTIKETVVRGVQFVRDAARLVLKVPIRVIKEPIWLSKNWKMYERVTINAKLTGYSFAQLLAVPAKFVVALAALASMATNMERAKWLLDSSSAFTKTLDGRASKLEALKEEGTNNASTPLQYKSYKAWINTINPTLCRK